MALSGCAPRQNPQRVAETGTAPKEVVETIDTDLLSSASAARGLLALFKAALDDTNCLVIEKNAESGGNALGVEGMFAINSSMQKAAGIEEITPAEVIAAQMECCSTGPRRRVGSEICEKLGGQHRLVPGQGVEYNGTVDNYYRAFCILLGSRGGNCSKATCPQ